MKLKEIPTFVIPTAGIYFKYLLMRIVEGNEQAMILRLLMDNNPIRDRSGIMFAMREESTLPLTSICDMGGGCLTMRKVPDPDSAVEHPGMTVTICAGGNNWGMSTMSKVEHDSVVLEILRGYFPGWNVRNLTPGPTRHEMEVPLLFP